jgi:hypothetical protein
MKWPRGSTRDAASKRSPTCICATLHLGLKDQVAQDRQKSLQIYKSLKQIALEYLPQDTPMQVTTLSNFGKCFDELNTTGPMSR